MRILSWNINGLRAIIKNRGFGTLTRLLKFLQAGAPHSPRTTLPGTVIVSLSL